jgi:phosphoribosylformylglycinamidine cyclo-ligase
VGQVAQGELERTLNMGVGMVALVAPEAANAAVTLLHSAGRPAWVAGAVVDAPDSAAPGTAELVGVHA